MLEVILKKQKNMINNKKILKYSINSSRKTLSSIFVIVFLIFSVFAGLNIVKAENYQEQINELSEQNAVFSNEIEELEEEAESYQDAITKLENKIGGLQKQIDANTAKQKNLQQQIKVAEAELEKQKDLLGKNIKAMYVEGDISTIEMLASSNDLSEFVDKQQYRSSVKEKIVATLDTINELKNKLKGQKEQVDLLIKEQEQQRASLALSRNKQNELLTFNESERADYNSKTKKNKKRIAELVRLQSIENARLFGSGGGQVGGGGYPWGKAPCLYGGHITGWCYDYSWGYNGSYNNWNLSGYAYRNCTDWVAYRVEIAGKHVPGGLGNANTWDDRAPSYGFKVSSKPKVGAAAVSNSGYYGHVMYVEAVNGDGSIVISDYNRAGPGEYGTNTLSAGTASALRYVYF
jgi:surface antigen/peptidoglycan hydrolase CwlO-like protein